LLGDYQALLECAEGLSIGPIGILGLSQVYEVFMPDWNYDLIAEQPLTDLGVLPPLLP
jgi:hypothetical protein